ncbi:hypothetical protein BS78_03G301800 [Paspalum vaginatum]|nr:hypothetical protein BS78_03G301800 [Paspalum vaginatum]
MTEAQDDVMKYAPDHSTFLESMDCRNSLVTVIDDNGNKRGIGTGFVIYDGPPRSLVLTCQHVVEWGVHVAVRKATAEGVEEYEAEVVHADIGTDVALLAVQGLPPSLALALVPPSQEDVGRCAVSLGFCNPLELFEPSALARLPAPSPGSLKEPGFKTARKSSAGVQNTSLILTCIAMEGMSGGPVVNKRGVIGMNKSISLDGQTLYAVSTSTIIQMLKKWCGFPVNGNTPLMDVLQHFQGLC